MITGTPSPVRRTSNSIPSQPTAIASRNAATVFSGATAEAPRWPMINGLYMVYSRKDAKKEYQLFFASLRLCGNLFCDGRRGNDALELDIKRAVIRLDASGHWYVPRVVSAPNRELTLLVPNQPVCAEQFRADSQHVDRSANGLH